MSWTGRWDGSTRKKVPDGATTTLAVVGLAVSAAVLLVTGFVASGLPAC